MAHSSREYMKKYMADRRAKERESKDLVLSAAKQAYGQADLDQGISDADEDVEGLNNQMRLKDLVNAYTQTVNEAIIKTTGVSKDLAEMRSKLSALETDAETDYFLTTQLRILTNIKVVLEGKEHGFGNWMKFSDMLVELSRYHGMEKTAYQLSILVITAKDLIPRLEAKIADPQIMSEDRDLFKYHGLDVVKKMVEIFMPTLEILKTKGWSVISEAKEE